MDIDVTKENIQPLRGGRNVQQLGMALQAQTNGELQMELQHQKEEFENLIRTYTGEDPLENHYNYILWIEQSYPKHGYEGNLVTLLEHCLELFENDKRYTDDRRFCKLWIKYFDLQPNPIELYHMLKNKGLCTGCADFYKAWAYYYEAAGDFQSANNIFEEAKRKLAQPYDELEIAHKNLIMAAGEHLIHGRNDENRLSQKRHALTSLHTYKPGRVSSVRVPSSKGAVALASTSSSGPKSNVPVMVYEGGEASGGSETAPVSLIAAVKRQNIIKENTMKPGPWTSMPVKKRVVTGNGTLGFVVHEDGNEPEGIRLPKNYSKETFEDYSDWNVLLYYSEQPPNPNMIPMYPKHKVYAELTTEYSLEELRAARYLTRKVDNDPQLVPQELNQMNNQPSNVQQFPVDVAFQNSYAKQQIPVASPFGQQNSSFRNLNRSSSITDPPPAKFSIWTPSPEPETQPNTNSHEKGGSINKIRMDVDVHGPSTSDCLSVVQQNSKDSPMNTFNENKNDQTAAVFSIWSSPNPNAISLFQQSLGEMQTQTPAKVSSYEKGGSSNKAKMDVDMHVPSTSGCLSVTQQNSKDSPINIFNGNKNEQMSDKFSIWTSPNPDTVSLFQQSLGEMQTQALAKGCAMKTAFNNPTADELVETGSRGGMDVATTAQPFDSAKPMPIFNESFSFYEDDDIFEEGGDELFDSSCNTNMFYNNLNAMQVSTPFKKLNTMIGSDVSEQVQKVLFVDDVGGSGDGQGNGHEYKDKMLSTIIEESKSYGSSSSSHATTKSPNLNNNTNKMGTIFEEHNSYLAENMMANAALRSSLLGNLVDLPASPIVTPQARAKFSICEDEDDDEVGVCLVDEETPPGSPLKYVPPPAKVQPLDFCPSDPFKAGVIKLLLERVLFPGQHNYGYYEIGYIPKITVKKEALVLNSDRYLVEKSIGKGTFGTVYKAFDLRRNKTVALKHQKPANKWEFYICREIQSRLSTNPLKDRFMNVTFGYFSDQGSVLISEFMPAGSLLDLTNLHKQKCGKLKEALVIYFVLQMLEIVETLHEIQIIHADIKPDNFLVFVSGDNKICLQLMDFGCSIDMSLFPPNSTFKRRIQTENFTCCEMLDGKSWNYHTDIFCIAATTHVLLFEDYIRLNKSKDKWLIKARMPRYYKHHVWNMFFDSLLNQKNGPADLRPIRQVFEEELVRLNKDSSTALAPQMRHVANLLKNR